jgi:hypothetical protein
MKVDKDESEFGRIWNSIEELRIVVDKLCQRIDGDHPKWSEPIPKDTPTPKQS